MADYVAASGTLMAAVLETAGYHYQAYVLQNLEAPFSGADASMLGSIGGFVYLIGVIVAVFFTAIRGGYKFGPWLLIGPPLFFAMVKPTEPVRSVLWRFATQGRDQAKVEEEYRRIDPQGSGREANVSKVFAHYNKLVSETVQEIVKVINRNKTQTDRWFVLRAQLLGQMNTHLVETPGLKQLIQHALFSNCGALVTAAQVVLDVNSSQARRSAAGEELKKYNLDTVLYKPTVTVANYLAARLEDFDPFQTGVTDANQCLQNETTPEGIHQFSKLGCACVWMFVYDGLLHEAKNTVLTARDLAAANDIDSSQILTSWAKAMRLIQDGPSTPGAANEAQVIQSLTNAIAKYILRNESSNQTFAGFLADSAEKSHEFGAVRAPLENNLALTEYARMRQSEWVEKTRVMTAAANLPYYQGLLLFFLALTFPFFALLLLVPGKHAGFIQWFVLWLWVKSWDIGFAIVMQLDDILFSLLNINQENLANNPVTRNELQQDFALAMFAMKQTDPTFQLATYYNIIGVCLSAIPVVSSQLIIGSLSGGAGIVAQGIKTLGDDYGAGASNTAGQQVVSTLRHRLQENVQARASLYYRNISQYQLAKAELGPGAGGDSSRHGEGSAGLRERAVVGAPSPGMRMSGPSDVGTQNILYGPNKGMHGEKLKDSNRTLENINYTLADVERAHRINRSLGAWAGGFANPTRVGLPIGGSPIVTGKLGTFLDAVRASKGYAGDVVFSPLERIYKAQADYFADIGEAHIDPMARWAVWDAFYNEEGQRLAAMARLYNMLEVPWTAGETPEIAEGRLEYAYLQQEAKLYGQILEAVGDSQSSILNVERAWRMMTKTK